MVVMANPHKMVAIRAEKSEDFNREFNKNIVSKEFLESCKKMVESFYGVDSDLQSMYYLVQEDSSCLYQLKDRLD